MARTTAEEVKVIIDTDLSDAIVNAFISDANLLVTQILGSSGLSTALLTSIEKWLSAHLIAVSRDRQASEEEVKDARIKYTGKTGTGLESTFYGQQVLLLDTSGLIEENMNSKPVTIIAIEKDSTSFEARIV